MKWYAADPMKKEKRVKNTMHNQAAICNYFLLYVD